jgi:ABC-type transporter MlaC component
MRKFLIGISFLLLSAVDINARVEVQNTTSIQVTNIATQKGQAASPYQIPTSQETVEFVKSLINKGMEIANRPGNHQQEFGELLRNNFITEEISKFVLGSKWRAMSADQRECFHQIYQKRLVQIYSAPEKVSTFKNTISKISESAASQVDGSVLVKSTFTNKDGTGEPAKVDWKVVKKNEKVLILDIMFEGVSKLTTERNDYGAIYSNQGKNDPETFLTYLQSTLKA